MNIRIFIAVVVTVVWAAGYAAKILDPSFNPPLEVNAVMLVIAGYFFGSGFRKKEEKDQAL